MAEETTYFDRTEEVANGARQTEQRPNFRIRDLLLLTLLTACVVGLRIPDVTYILVAATFTAIACLGLLLVSHFYPQRRKRMAAEDFFSRLVVKTLWICFFAVLLCGLSIVLNTTLSSSTARQWDEVLKSLRAFR